MPWLVIILAGALGLRLVAALLIQNWVERTPGRLCLIAGDAEGYWELGRHLARGEEYALYEPPRRVLRMPGFPMLLAGGMRLFGEQTLWIRLILAGVGTAGCALVYLLARTLFDEGTALRACALAAVFPTFVGFSPLLLSETLFATLLVASLIPLARLFRGGTGRLWGAALTAGVLCGLATLVRPTWLLVGPAAAFLHLLTSRDRPAALRHALILLSGLALTLLPWTIRNFQVTGHFIPTTLWVGPSLYDGLHAEATGASDMRFIETDRIYETLSEYDADRHYRAAAWSFVRENPGRAAQLAAIKVARFWNPFPNADQFGHWAIGWSVALATLPLWLLAAWGGWRWRQVWWCWFVPLAPILYFSLVHTVFVSSVRYRLPAEYALWILSAAGWTAWQQRHSPSHNASVPSVDRVELPS
ncbi:MAG: ArnT family glycosyltransferase [Planctomycetales bacterium]